MDLIEAFLFATVSFMTLIGGLMVVGSRNLVHAGFWLLPFFLGIGGFYLLMNMEFLFVLQLLIYAGAVMVLVLFALMLTKNVMSKKLSPINKLFYPGLASGFGMIVILSIFVWRALGSYNKTVLPVEGDIIRNLGKMLLTDYVLPFELTSALLLSALLGAIFLARKPEIMQGGHKH